MGRLLAIFAAAALVVGITALSVNVFDDRETMIPPPDAVAEGFVREVLMKRWARARPYLVEEMSDAQLEALEQSLESRVGDAMTIEAELLSRDDEQALVTVRLEGPKGSEAVSYALRFDEEWKVALAR